MNYTNSNAMFCGDSIVTWAENTREREKTKIIYYVLTKPHSILSHDTVTAYGHFRSVTRSLAFTKNG